MKKIVLIATFFVIAVNVIAQNIPNYVPTSGLVAWFPYNNSVLNQAGLSTTGTSTNYNATFTRDRFNRPNSSVYFKQTTNCATRIENTINTSFINGGFSLSFWVKRDSAGCDNPRVFAFDGIQCMWWDNSQSLTLCHADNVNSVCATSSTILNNEWVNIIYTNDGVTAKFYQNGILFYSTVNTLSNVSLLGNNFYVGMLSMLLPLHGGFRGSVDDIGIWNRALSVNEVANLKNAYQATVLHVDNSSVATIENGSIATPYKTIQAAINNAQNYDTLLLAPGIYYDSVRYNTKNLVLASNYIFNNDTNTINNTIIDGVNLGKPIVILEKGQNLNSKFIGITFRNGRSVPSGGGTFQFRNAGSGPSVGEIRNCNIIGNVSTSWEGGAISAYYSGSVLHGSAMSDPIQINNCTFKNNISTQIGGCIRMFVSDIQINKCTFINSTGSTGSAIHSWRSQPSISNSVFINNSNETICFTGDVAPTAKPVLRNCTFYENNKILVLNSGVQLYSINNIFNSPVSSAIRTNSNAYFESNNLYNTINSIDNNTFSFTQAKFGSANFVNPSNYNFRLKQNSIAVGAGTDSTILNAIKIKSLVFDKDNNIRPQPINSKPDIGAYENSFSQPTPFDTLKLIKVLDTLKVPNNLEIIVVSSNLTDQNIGSYQFTFNYNSSKFKLDSISKLNTSSSAGLLFTNKLIPGVINVSWMSTANINNQLPLLRFHFTAIDSGNSTFTIQNAFLNTRSVTTLLNTSIVNKYVYGDIDINNKIQAYDAMLALRYSVGLDPIPTIDPLPWESWRVKIASVDTSRFVTANDASLILKYVVGLITQFPKRGLNLTPGYITTSIENNQIVIRSYEDLGGININFMNHQGSLGAPTFIYNSDVISEINNQTGNYKIGMAFTLSPTSGTVILKIPFNNNNNLTINMEIFENASFRNSQLNTVTGVDEVKNASISIFPNPTNNIIYITGLGNNNNSAVSIYDVRGLLVFSKEITNSTEIDLSTLTNGVYVIKVGDAVKRIVKM